jgi:glycosyltransferase involved in cell wall biosynthesis
VTRRVLLAISSLHRGGAERQFVELVRGLDRARWEPRVALCDTTDEYGVDLGAGPVIDLQSAGGSTVLTGLRLAAALRRERPAVVHTFGGLLNIYGRLAVRATGVGRMVSAVREGVPNPRDTRLEGMTSGLTDALVVNSVGTRDELVRRAGIAAERIDVVPNGVDTVRFAPLDGAVRAQAREAFAMRGVTLAVLSRMSAEKNHLAIVRALGLLRRGGAADALRLVFAGRVASKSIDDALRAAIVEEGVGDAVTFTGPCDAPERLLAGADGVLQASLYEGMSNVVLEALACGTPVIVSPPADRDGNVRDGVEGLRLTGTDAPAIAAGMARFLALPPARRAAMGESARLRAERDLSLSAMIARTCAVWERVLAG